MGWFDDAVRRWRAEAARRAVVATASAAASATRSAVERVVERVAGEGERDSEGEEPAEDRLGRAAQIRADAQAREDRRAAAKDVVDRVGDLVRRGTGGGGGSTG